MTATRDRRSDPAEDAAETAWDDRPILGTSRGLPWWGAVLLGFGLAAVTAVVDMVLQDSLGKIYQGGYLLGCVGAVCWVRRRSLFGPMVQPPLVFAVTAIAAVVLLDPETGGGSGLRQLVIAVALPLTSNFPTMAITTGVALAIGLYRLWKERDPNPPVRANTGPSRKDRVPPVSRPGRGEEQEPRGGSRGRTRDSRRDASPRDRANRRDREPPPDRSTRDRPRDQEPPPRRRDPRPRRDERPAPNRRDQQERGGSRQPRRRPPDQYR